MGLQTGIRACLPVSFRPRRPPGSPRASSRAVSSEVRRRSPPAAQWHIQPRRAAAMAAVLPAGALAALPAAPLVAAVRSGLHW
mmetsp:Transcript_34122/g.77077  ORF Transcript_34122/g.77077 Transcript_34122/m.77077 type:complete len:83 (+) Transcript_34122:462-710(+)